MIEKEIEVHISDGTYEGYSVCSSGGAKTGVRGTCMGETHSFRPRGRQTSESGLLAGHSTRSDTMLSFFLVESWYGCQSDGGGWLETTPGVAYGRRKA
jgi:hypothetical protein